ncbi:hypothetical protein EDM52_21370 [Brevibacillus invocatus]|uniref:Uncharacterized protein n=1 Tax=Brevibacillus invocatus TaxID=173959 RepID=A0A3M8BX88_9BACL|nr:hypothetical protein EDM52_21370 [Brevibacillus invocatus]
MLNFESIVLSTLFLVSWGFIVSSNSLRKKWVYILITFIIFWVIVELVNYFDPPSPPCKAFDVTLYFLKTHLHKIIYNP